MAPEKAHRRRTDAERHPASSITREVRHAGTAALHRMPAVTAKVLAEVAALSAGENAENWKAEVLLLRIQSGAAALGNSLTVPDCAAQPSRS